MSLSVYTSPVKIMQGKQPFNGKSYASFARMIFTLSANKYRYFPV